MKTDAAAQLSMICYFADSENIGIGEVGYNWLQSVPALIHLISPVD